MTTIERLHSGIRQVALGLGVCALCSVSALAHASDIPSLEKRVLLNAREQPIDQFLIELFGHLGVPAQIDDDIIGSVNGGFKKSAGEVLSEITAAFQLSVYYDGTVAYVYPSNDIRQEVVYMSPKEARQVVQAVNKLGLPDDRNSLKATGVGLIITGADRFVDQVESLGNAVKKTASKPAEAAPYSYRIFKLKYAWADDVSLVIGGETVVVPGVASLIRQLIEPGSLGVASTGRTPAPTSLEGLRGKGLNSRGLQQVRQGGAIVESGGASAGASAAASAAASTQTEISRPNISGVVGGSVQQTRIVADPLSNSVIIRDREDRLSGYETLIESLDKEPQMIEIEATIIDLDTDKLRELGVNWRLQQDDSEVLLGNGTAADQLLRPGETVTPQGNGGIVSLVLGSRQEFIARIRALETQGAARIVSKPHVMTLSNVEALLDTTSTFFVRVAGQEEVDLFDVKVGTKLRVTPHVYEKGSRKQIKLRVNITDGSASDDRTVDSIPIIEESNINTQAIVDVGQSLLIGGLVREMKGNGTTRVPVLGRIPVLGGLFRSQTKTSSRQERMFLITPRVSSPHTAGKRFSAPVLSGSENDIISSASTRMFGTRQSLNRLDEVYPLEQRLPQGNGLTTSHQLPGVPFQPVDPSQRIAVDQASAIAPQRKPLRERLAVPDGQSVTGRPVQPSLPARPPIDTQSLQVIVNQTSQQDTWQTVGSTSAVVTTAPGHAGDDEYWQPAPQMTSSSAGFDKDEWQEIK